jgi:hypothetical protein|tara:strand:- start:500 stop:1093 length:594 start_codon:yes stop_codon:yes gene_type:complete
MDPFESYKLYNALKLHFETDNYDVFKYNFKTKVKPQSFFNRRDKYFFAKIGKNYGKDTITYYVANFKEGVSYVGDMVNEVGETNFKNHQKVAQSITRVFQDDINKLGEVNEVDFDGLFISEDGQQPLIIQLWLQGEIQLETVVILDSILGFISRESKNISDTLIWPDIKRKIEKYNPFVKFDSIKCKNILLEGFTNT